MEGIPEKDMEERRRMLEQKNQGINTTIISGSISLSYMSDSAHPGFQRLRRRSRTRMTLMNMMTTMSPVPPFSSLLHVSHKLAMSPL